MPSQLRLSDSREGGNVDAGERHRTGPPVGLRSFRAKRPKPATSSASSPASDPRSKSLRFPRLPEPAVHDRHQPISHSGCFFLVVLDPSASLPPPDRPQMAPACDELQRGQTEAVYPYRTSL